MTPYVQDPDFSLYLGDVREVLRELSDASVDCVATSPPFYALRDYGVDGQIGLEETPELWVDELVGVFAECRRVLKPTGTLWVECGDSYVSGQGGRQSAVGELPPSTRFDRKEAGEKREGLPSSFGERDVGPRFYPGRATGLKPKDLLGQPWMLAFGLRADGWWLRQSIVWHKPNAMPESATDRCTTAHSYVFLLSKQARYHFDGQAIGEQFSDNSHSRGSAVPRDVPKTHEPGKGIRNSSSFTQATWGQPYLEAARKPQSETLDGSDGEAPRGPDGRRATHVRKGENSLQHRDGDRWPNEQRHPRSVWTVPTQSFSDAHFATWPEALVERIIKAGCPEGGTVLDPFMGSGTTALVARRLGRKSVGIELNEEYAALAARRLSQLSLLAEEDAA